MFGFESIIESVSVVMWSFAPNAIASLGLKKNWSKNSLAHLDESDDENEVTSESSSEEGLECPICWESFNIVENVPYVLWCGHTICKNCVLGLQCASMKISNQKVQIPFCISCPWCHLLSLRVVYHGNLKFPRKNYFLLWMVEGLNGDRVRSCNTPSEPCESSQLQPSWFSKSEMRRVPQPAGSNGDNSNAQRRRHNGFNKPLDFFIHLTTKLLLLIMFLLIVLFVVPASAAVLATYLIITVIFAIPSLLILYFAYPTIDWLVREVTS